MNIDNIYRVAYKGKSGGIVTYSDCKAIFPDRQLSKDVTIGVVSIDTSSYVEKENYKFANMTNVKTITPKEYGTLEFYTGIGVPTTIHKGLYGDCVFFKETYFATTYIKAYLEDGTVIIKEFMDNKKGKGAITYRQIDEVVEWIDITERIHKQVMADLESKKDTPTATNLNVLCTVKPIEKVDVIQSTKGYLIACGKFESMVVWKEKEDTILSSWVGQIIKDDGVSVKHEMISYMYENHLINKNMYKCKDINFELTDCPTVIKEAIALNVIKAYCVLYDAEVDKENSILLLELSEKTLKLDVDAITKYLKTYNTAQLMTLSKAATYKKSWRKALYHY